MVVNKLQYLPFKQLNFYIINVQQKKRNVNNFVPSIIKNTHKK